MVNCSNFSANSRLDLSILKYFFKKLARYAYRPICLKHKSKLISLASLKAGIGDLEKYKALPPELYTTLTQLGSK